ncbi:hypothetical protein MFRU_007g01240 [Monilinia fructicola]|nr:hypothetical protein MFRU_007g01240 [Monilinia fructicola]
MPPMRDFARILDDEDQTLNIFVVISEAFRMGMHLSHGSFGLDAASLIPFLEVDFNQTYRDGKQPTEDCPEFNPRQNFAGVAGLTPPKQIIPGIPHLSGMNVAVGGQVLDYTVNVATSSNFTSSMNCKVAA